MDHAIEHSGQTLFAVMHREEGGYKREGIRRLIEIAGERILAGAHRVVRTPVTVGPDGGAIDLYGHVVPGSVPGTTLLLAGVQHGDEWQEIELLRRVVLQAATSVIAGNLLVVPVCSPTALGKLTRITQASSDGLPQERVQVGISNLSLIYQRRLGDRRRLLAFLIGWSIFSPLDRNGLSRSNRG